MKNFLILICIVVSAFLLSISILYAKAPSDSVESKPEVFIEAMMVQVSNDTLAKLQLDNNVDTLSNVTVPLPVLLYVLADPNAIKTIASARVKTPVGQAGKIDTREKMNYLVKTDEGFLEEKTTDTPIGITFEATPTIIKHQKILLNFKFAHYTVIPPKMIDPRTSLPIVKPGIRSRSVNIHVNLNSGEIMIVGSTMAPHSKVFTLVRAEIAKN